MLLTILKKYIPRLLRSMHREFKVPAEEQRKYLQKFDEPTDDFERAYFQYKCQQVFWGRLYSFAANCAAVILLPIQYRKFRKMAENAKDNNSTQTELVLVADEMPDGIFPDELLNAYKTYEKTGAMDAFYFDSDDINFFLRLKKRYSHSPYFLYKCLMKQAGYSYIIHFYRPLAIASCGAECTYTASYLTAFCHKKGVQHFDVMHGEMFYYILDAFGSFDRFYVWDDYYMNLLQSLRVRSDFIMALPKSIKIDFDSVDAEDIATADYKYYLQMQDGRELEHIAESMKKLTQMGYSVAVRYHPRTINLPEIERLFDGISIENPKEVPIEKSIKATKNVVGLNSTVLFQTYISGKNVVIDDISNRWMYEKLRELQYILIDKKCDLLSQHIQEKAI